VTTQLDVDPVLVDRACKGGPAGKAAFNEANRLEREEIVRSLHSDGLTDAAIGRRVGRTGDGIRRIRMRLGLPTIEPAHRSSYTD